MQLDYNQPAASFAGMLGNANPHTAITAVNGESSAALPFGVGVAQGTADNECKLPAATGFKFKGITLHTHRVDTATLAGAGAIAAGESGPLITQGEVWVPVEGAVTAGNQAFCRFSANGGNTQLGAFRADADTAHADAVAGSVFRTSTTGAGLALLAINIP